MVVDTSAIMAILRLEPEAEEFARAIESATLRLVSAVSVLEAGILSRSRRGEEGARELDDFLREGDFEIVSFDAEQVRIARRAYSEFGKGRHRAGLNLGDCAVYALSKSAGEPLMFKGDDFARTDIEVFSGS